jgi:hypothetical protein
MFHAAVHSGRRSVHTLVMTILVGLTRSGWSAGGPRRLLARSSRGAARLATYVPSQHHGAIGVIVDAQLERDELGLVISGAFEVVGAIGR